MAVKQTKAKTSSSHVRVVKGSKKRKGVHSKRNASKCKSSKNYLKRKRGQG